MTYPATDPADTTGPIEVTKVPEAGEPVPTASSLKLAIEDAFRARDVDRIPGLLRILARVDRREAQAVADALRSYLTLPFDLAAIEEGSALPEHDGRALTIPRSAVT